jgi:hypothetical protein
MLTSLKYIKILDETIDSLHILTQKRDIHSHQPLNLQFLISNSRH